MTYQTAKTVHPATRLDLASRSRLLDTGGFSLIELMVASLVSMLVVGGVMTMLVTVNDVHRNSQELIDSQQAARIAMEQMQRDVQIAGVGLLWLLPPTPVIIPRVDGGIDIRQNQGGIMSGLVADMANVADAFTVSDVTGFMPGMEIAIYDARGTIDFVTITAVDTGNDRLSHTGASKAYTVAEGSAVARIMTISYFLEQINGIWTLVREEDGANRVPIAANVVLAGTSIVYWDDSTPSVVFTPNTNSLQMRITTIEIALEIATANTMLGTNIRRSTVLSTRITPRAMVLS